MNKTKFMTFYRPDGMTISIQHDEIYDNPWSYSDETEVYFEKKNWEDEWIKCDKRK